MNDWKTLKQKSLDVGGNNFIEVSLKEPPKGDNTLIALSKGWYTPDEKKKYKANILFSKEKKQELIDIIEEISKED